VEGWREKKRNGKDLQQGLESVGVAARHCWGCRGLSSFPLTSRGKLYETLPKSDRRASEQPHFFGHGCCSKKLSRTSELLWKGGRRGRGIGETKIIFEQPRLDGASGKEASYMHMSESCCCASGLDHWQALSKCRARVNSNARVQEGAGRRERGTGRAPPPGGRGGERGGTKQDHTNELRCALTAVPHLL
jgi:hypothetical protein